MRLNSRRLAVNGKRLAALYSSRVSAEIHSMLGRFLLFTLTQYVKTDPAFFCDQMAALSGFKSNAPCIILRSRSSRASRLAACKRVGKQMLPSSTSYCLHTARATEHFDLDS
jgi:hypothetical protein